MRALLWRGERVLKGTSWPREALGTRTRWRCDLKLGCRQTTAALQMQRVQEGTRLDFPPETYWSMEALLPPGEKLRVSSHRLKGLEQEEPGEAPSSDQLSKHCNTLKVRVRSSRTSAWFDEEHYKNWADQLERLERLSSSRKKWAPGRSSQRFDKAKQELPDLCQQWEEKEKKWARAQRAGGEHPK